MLAIAATLDTLRARYSRHAFSVCLKYEDGNSGWMDGLLLSRQDFLLVSDTIFSLKIVEEDSFNIFCKPRNHYILLSHDFVVLYLFFILRTKDSFVSKNFKHDFYIVYSFLYFSRRHVAPNGFLLVMDI